MSSPSPLSELLEVLSANVKALESGYNQKGFSFPDLNAPFAPSPADSDPHLANLTRIVVGAAAQLIATVRPPMTSIQEYTVGYYGSAALNVVVDGHVANILKDSGDEGLHITEIGKKAKVRPDRIGRVLRYLATRHIFREVKPDVFANNRVSSMLLKKNTYDDIVANPNIEYEGSPAAAFVGHTSDEGMKGGVHIPAWIKDTSDQYTTPFNLGLGRNTNLFQWYETEDYRRRRFAVAMSAASHMYPAEIYSGGFDWKSLPNDSTVVDVGGSIGSVTLIIAKANPHLRYVVQDLEKVIRDDTTKFWAENMPSAVKEGRVVLQGADFFEEQKVKNAAVYFMRSVMHDWPDDKCVEILRNTRKAAGANSKLVVFEVMMPYACKYDGEFSEAVNPPDVPAPLLANLGLGFGGTVTWRDMQMMNFFDGKERTVLSFVEIGKQSGWKLESVKPGVMATLVFSAI